MNIFEKILAVLFLGCVCLGALGAGALFYIIQYDWIDFSVLEQYEIEKPSIVLDDEGREWTRFQLDRCKPITFDKMPSHLINAFIAAEDHAFFQHAGLSYKGIVRSIIVNLYYGRRMQGASTITQQLVRLLFFDAKKTFKRKLKEQFYALMVERQFSKEHILEAYLNNICLGCGIYGVEAACRHFWAKSAKDITINQAATLACIVKSPQHYSPLLYPLSSEKRRNVILCSMERLGFITQEEYDNALAVPVTIQISEKDVVGLHLKEMIRQFLEHLVGKQQLYTGGFVIQTTINQRMQRLAEEKFKKHLEKLKIILTKDIDGALLSVDVKMGEIKALIGGINFLTSQFNRAVQARRQIGSTIKPVVYAAALLQGYTFTDIFIDEPIEISQGGVLWKPHNNTHHFEGKMTLARALSHSNNIISIKALLEVGAHNVAQLVRAMHLGDDIPAYPSLALGCIDCSLEQVVGMFNIFTNHGVYVEPHVIKWIKNAWGEKIWKYKEIRERVLPARISDQVVRVLSLGIERARRLYKDTWLDAEAFGKTGTTNNSRTSWFIGATPSLTTGIYIGCDDNRSMGKNIYGVRTAFPIWLQLYRNILNPVKRFFFDASLHEVTIDSRTGKKIANRHSPHAITILC